MKNFLQRLFARFQSQDPTPTVSAPAVRAPLPARNTGRVLDPREREALRESLATFVVGEVRLAKNSDETILDFCGERIQDEFPPEETGATLEWATERLQNARRQHASESNAWPETTDCDRLDRAESALLDDGILLWQASPCCDNCTLAELPDRLAWLEEQHPGFSARMQGYAFFLDQNMPEELGEGTQIAVLLGYGWKPAKGETPDDETYQKHAVRIGQQVRKRLEEQNLPVDWDGSLSKKMGLSLDWKRRGSLA